ncbi:hypothetical protein TNCV_2857461 [Trichonephila clavipes]|nr:hypothetical protein TNCV_2857461 [Trichonephila clavipes]
MGIRRLFFFRGFKGGFLAAKFWTAMAANSGRILVLGMRRRKVFVSVYLAGKFFLDFPTITWSCKQKGAFVLNLGIGVTVMSSVRVVELCPASGVYPVSGWQNFVLCQRCVQFPGSRNMSIVRGMSKGLDAEICLTSGVCPEAWR